jgi:hypothetical protein
MLLIDQCRLNPTQLFRMKKSREALDRILRLLSEIAIDGKKAPLVLAARPASRFEDSGGAKKIGPGRAKRIREFVESGDAWLRTSPVLDFADIRPAQSGLVGENALIDTLRKASPPDPFAEHDAIRITLPGRFAVGATIG